MLSIFFIDFLKPTLYIYLSMVWGNLDQFKARVYPGAFSKLI